MIYCIRCGAKFEHNDHQCNQCGIAPSQHTRQRFTEDEGAPPVEAPSIVRRVNQKPFPVMVLSMPVGLAVLFLFLAIWIYIS
ncbi:hypothetical protein N781_01705 [Pontibacillus halophilus JSM 076056 = DSM 19796]|uniref:Uncharacterized protein n=1 Tax=Pontibacillus halophilus JSM 076056 = DSM 19796 TaxID=1385510 RepID=A0A0A5GQ63_9BACI|nr:hypothetical protein [Pontibacillus halophilus]KGX94089.1 hypothetical protein N781_01705 [Pontibacillus halophilus JSM 076056 = DSM 19796]